MGGWPEGKGREGRLAGPELVPRPAWELRRTEGVVIISPQPGVVSGGGCVGGRRGPSLPPCSSETRPACPAAPSNPTGALGPGAGPEAKPSLATHMGPPTRAPKAGPALTSTSPLGASTLGLDTPHSTPWGFPHSPLPPPSRCWLSGRPTRTRPSPLTSFPSNLLALGLSRAAPGEGGEDPPFGSVAVSTGKFQLS